MHKLSKGLKKKIKGKKSKEKEEELDHAELVKLRREAQEAAETAAAKAAANSNANPSDSANGEHSESAGQQQAACENKPESEEWLKFKLLTSGNYTHYSSYLFFLSVFNMIHSFTIHFSLLIVPLSP